MIKFYTFLHKTFRFYAHLNGLLYLRFVCIKLNKRIKKMYIHNVVIESHTKFTKKVR